MSLLAKWWNPQCKRVEEKRVEEMIQKNIPWGSDALLIFVHIDKTKLRHWYMQCLLGFGKPLYAVAIYPVLIAGQAFHKTSFASWQSLLFVLWCSLRKWLMWISTTSLLVHTCDPILLFLMYKFFIIRTLPLVLYLFYFDFNFCCWYSSIRPFISDIDCEKFLYIFVLPSNY